MNYFFILLLVLMPAIAFSDDATRNHTKSFRYSLWSGNDDIGDMVVNVEKKENHSIVIMENSHINVSGWWGKIDVRTSNVESFSENGHILHADSKILDGKELFWSEAKTIGSDFFISYSKINNITKKEAKDFFDMASILNNHAAPLLDEAVIFSQKLLSYRKTIPQKHRYSINDYDASFSYLPFFWLNNKQQFPEEIAIFDIEEITVEVFNIEDLGVKVLQLGSRYLTTQHYKLRPSKGEPIEIWLSIDEKSTPYFVQMIGDDEGDPFRMIINL